MTPPDHAARRAQRCRELLAAGDVAGFARERPRGRLDLSGVDLSGCKLAGVALDDVVLARAALVGTDLSDASLRRTVLDRADLTKANLERAVFSREARLRYACLAQVRARGADLEGSDLTRADLTGADFSDARLNHAVAADATLSGARFDRAELHRAFLLGATVEGTSFREANLGDAVLIQAKGKDADFSGANLTRADALRAILHGPKLRFTGAYVKGFRNDGLDQALRDAVTDHEPPPGEFPLRKLPVDPSFLVDGIPNSDRPVFDAALRSLNELVGLADVKRFVRRLSDVMRTQHARSDAGLPPLDYSLHFVFTGSPGTGKTSVARSVSQVLRGIGYLEKGHLVETDRSGMVAGFVGQTAIKTAEVIDQANGGTLLIDEAYTLSSESGGTDYAGEAVATLLKRMEDRRGTFSVIVAGYTEEMHSFVRSNPGLQSRFTKFIAFSDYSDHELMDILLRMTAAKRLTTTPDYLARASVRLALRRRRDGAEFANGRTVRNFVQESIERMAERVIADAEEQEFLQRCIELATDGRVVELDQECDVEARRRADCGRGAGVLTELAARVRAHADDGTAELTAWLRERADALGPRGDLTDPATLSRLDATDAPEDALADGIELSALTWERDDGAATRRLSAHELDASSPFPRMSDDSVRRIDAAALATRTPRPDR